MANTTLATGSTQSSNTTNSGSNLTQAPTHPSAVAIGPDDVIFSIQYINDASCDRDFKDVDDRPKP